jgi:hypothetical protein
MLANLTTTPESDYVDGIDDVLIVIPSRRPPPIKTIQSFPSVLMKHVVIISDPTMFTKHMNWLESMGYPSHVSGWPGKVGMIPQSAECYRVAFKLKYKYYFRMDDDLHPKTFVTHTGIVDVLPAILAARRCAAQLGTSLNGFVNTARRDWLGEGYKKSYGLIHGGAHLCIAAEDPSEFIDEKLPAYEDVYRSAAHRLKDGAVGRVSFIGLDKRESLRDSSMNKSPSVIKKSKEIILKKFPGMVTCNGTRVLDDGRQEIPNWRMVGRVK